jgi:hypothetical protein
MMEAEEMLLDQLALLALREIPMTRLRQLQLSKTPRRA